jgi:RNA polymerase II-associated protein 1
VFCRPLTTLLSAYLGLSRLLPGISDELWMAQAFSILGRFIPGDEDYALRIFEQVLQMPDAKWMTMRGWHIPPKLWDKGGLEVIKPFLAHTIRPTGSFIGPMWPSPRSISLSATQTLPSGANVYAERSLDSGLPLDKDWTLSSLNHLLRSGQSTLLQSLPSSWDANETEVVRASLLFTKIFQEILHPFLLVDFMLTREEVVFGCMKVFMLEHGQHQDGTVEVFRDEIVGQFMNDLLAPFTIAAATSTPYPSPAPSSARNNLERVASRFLGASTPFYQYYTDFVALYDSVSFSHPLFARLLLPPTSMRYPPDYRKHLWNDFGHVLRSIQTPFDQIVASGIEEYLWPVEDDPQIIGAYLRSLVHDRLAEFVRLVAVHHVACNIWPDLRQGATLEDERSRKLLVAVVGLGNFDAVREVVTYRQPHDGKIILPPECFQGDGEWQKLRLEYVKTWGDLSLAERLATSLDVIVSVHI